MGRQARGHCSCCDVGRGTAVVAKRPLEVQRFGAGIQEEAFQRAHDEAIGPKATKALYPELSGRLSW